MSKPYDSNLLKSFLLSFLEILSSEKLLEGGLCLPRYLGFTDVCQFLY